MNRKYKFHNKEGVLLVYCNFRGARGDACASGAFELVGRLTAEGIEFIQYRQLVTR